MGIADAKLERSEVRDPLCGSVASTPYDLDTHSFAAFQRDLAIARPIAETFLFATRLAEETGGPRGEGTGPALLARTLGEQVLRKGMNWGQGGEADGPPLSPPVRAIMMSRIGAAMGDRDHANTEWLKRVVDREGWPSVPKVGEFGSSAAWLLVQHADAQPAFQLKALRLMEPLAAKGDVSKQNYAYLYDRVMLKIRGIQRYGTQASCEGGKRVPRPLEDAGAVARHRAGMGLEPLPTYMAFMDANYGPCPAN